MNKTKNKLRVFLSDVVDNRGRNPEKYFDNEKYPVIDNYLIKNTIYPDLSKTKRFIDQNTHDNFLRKYLSKDDVLITLVGNGICSVSLAPSNNVVIIQNTIGFKTNEKLNNKFLYYYFLNNQSNLIKLDRGSSQPSVNQQDLLDFEIEIPADIAYQQKIAAVLSSLDSKIELNNKINAELEAMAKTLYDYWFVQFDFPDTDGKPYKTSGGKMVWNDELKREIPDGWEVGTLSDISDLIRGVSYNSNEIKNATDENVVAILRATNITGNVIDLQNMVYVDSKNVSKNQFLNKYNILITMSSGSIEHIGKNGFYYFNNSVSYGAFCAKLVAKENYHFYLYSYTQSDFVTNTIKNECLGTNINNLNSKLINDFKILLPSKDVITRFNIKLSAIHEKIGNDLTENQTLSELRDWLLPMLMNGQVGVG
jgi:type I restriction enzyme S subunit